jgi:hypothetical protein
LSPRYEQKIGSNLSMHSGVNTGLAVTADVDPEKGTHGVTGDAINVAAKLRDLAGAHEILVGPDTYKASNTHCTFQPLKPAKIKGKSGLIPIYKVVSVKAATAHAHQEMQIFSEMREPVGLWRRQMMRSGSLRTSAALRYSVSCAGSEELAFLVPESVLQPADSATATRASGARLLVIREKWEFIVSPLLG